MMPNCRRALRLCSAHVGLTVGVCVGDPGGRGLVLSRFCGQSSGLLFRISLPYPWPDGGFTRFGSTGWMSLSISPVLLVSLLESIESTSFMSALDRVTRHISTNIVHDKKNRGDMTFIWSGFLPLVGFGLVLA